MRRQSTTRALCLTGALLVAAGAALAQEPVRLLRTYKMGDALRYRYEVNGKVGGAEFTVTGKTKFEVESLGANGDVRSVETQEEMRLTVMGAEQPSPVGKPTLVTRDLRGRLLDARFGEGTTPPFGPEVARLLFALGEPLMPEKAVAPNESWETELDNPAAAGKKVKVKTTFVAAEKLGEKPVWRLRQSVKASAGEGELTHESTHWLDAANGHLLKQEATVEGVPTPLGAMSWTERIERL